MCCVFLTIRFRNGFKYVFRWLPWIKWRSCDVLGIRGTTTTTTKTMMTKSCRGGGGGASVSEGGTKYTFTFNENNGCGATGSRVIGLRMHSIGTTDVGLLSSATDGLPTTTQVKCTPQDTIIGHAAAASAAAARNKYRFHHKRDNKTNANDDTVEV